MKRTIEVKSDGTVEGTHVTIDGKPLDGIIGLSWEINTDRGFAILTLRRMARGLNATSTILGDADHPIEFSLTTKA